MFGKPIADIQNSVICLYYECLFSITLIPINLISPEPLQFINKIYF